MSISMQKDNFCHAIKLNMFGMNLQNETKTKTDVCLVRVGKNHETILCLLGSRNTCEDIKVML